MNRGLGVLFVVAVAVSMIGYSGNPASAPAALPEEGSTADANSGPSLSVVLAPERCKVDQDFNCPPNCGSFCPAQPLRDTIKSFFPNNAGQTGDYLEVPLNVQGGLKFVVAIVPDPVHTHLSLFFDRSIDAIEQGAQRAGYAFDRAIMPWDYLSHPESTDFVTRLRQAEYARNKEQLPGLMILRAANPNLRANDPADAPLFVFIVGETPTGGIHKEQFRKALLAIRKIRDTQSGQHIPLRIVGPTFSGSLFSLQQLLTEQQSGDFTPVWIHSGTASSWQTIDWFQQNKRSDVYFATFQESDRYATRRFIQFAIDHHYETSKIAVLSEEETAYGSELFQHPKPVIRKGSGSNGNPPKLTPEEERAEKAKKENIENDIEKNVVQLYFPREISQLRTAYQRDLHVDESAEAGGHRASRSTLRLNLEDTGTDEDSVPPYSRLQTPLSQEAVLLGIVTNLQKHGSQFVIIRATNPLDQLFLARYLRTAYPEGRLVTSGSDLLLRREVESNLLHGTLAITSYSLVPGSDDDASYPRERPASSHSDYVFPNSYSTGTYNAVLSLLECLRADNPMRRDKGNDKYKDTACQPANQRSSAGLNDLPVAHYAEYGWPDIGGGKDPASKVLAPPLQLIALGRYGYWRLALLDGQPYTNDQMQPHSNIHSIRGDPVKGRFKTEVPHPWKLLCGIFSGIVLTFLVFLWRGSLWSASEAMANLAPIPDGARRAILFATGLLLLAALLLLAGPWIRWSNALLPSWWLYWFPALAVILVVRLFVELERRKPRKGEVWIFLLLSVVFVGIALWFFNWGDHWGDALQKNLLLYRYMQLSSGLSPALPWLLLIAALLWWAWYSLVGLALLDQRRPHLPKRDELFGAPPRNAPQSSAQLSGEQSSVEKQSTTQLCGTQQSSTTPPSDTTVSNIQSSTQPGDTNLQQLGRLHLTEEANEKLVRLGRPFSWDPRIYMPILLVGAMVLMIVDSRHPVQSLEGGFFDWAYAIAFTGIILWLLCTLLRLAVIWLECRRLLIALDSIPLRRSFQWLSGFSWKPIWRVRGSVLQDSFRIIEREMDSLRSLQNVEKVPGLEPPTKERNAVDKSYTAAVADSYTAEIDAQVQKPPSGEAAVDSRKLPGVEKIEEWLDHFWKAVREPGRTLSTFLEQLQQWFGHFRKAVSAVLVEASRRLAAPFPRTTSDKGATLTKTLIGDFETLQIALAARCVHALTFLNKKWAKEKEVQTESGSHIRRRPKPALGTECRAEGSEDKAREDMALEMRLAEEFVCLVYVNFILSVLMRMRSLVMAAIGMFVFLLLSVGYYPFEPKQTMYSLLILLFLLILGFVAVVYAQMHRDSTLSRITDTTPGELGFDFWIRLAGFTAVPLLSLLLAHFPGVNNFLFSWLEPALQGWK